MRCPMVRVSGDQPWAKVGREHWHTHRANALEMPFMMVGCWWSWGSVRLLYIGNRGNLRDGGYGECGRRKVPSPPSTGLKSAQSDDVQDLFHVEMRRGTKRQRKDAKRMRRAKAKAMSNFQIILKRHSFQTRRAERGPKVEKEAIQNEAKQKDVPLAASSERPNTTNPKLTDDNAGHVRTTGCDLQKLFLAEDGRRPEPLMISSKHDRLRYVVQRKTKLRRKDTGDQHIRPASAPKNKHSRPNLARESPRGPDSARCGLTSRPETPAIASVVDSGFISADTNDVCGRTRSVSVGQDGRASSGHFVDNEPRQGNTTRQYTVTYVSLARDVLHCECVWRKVQIQRNQLQVEKQRGGWDTPVKHTPAGFKTQCGHRTTPPRGPD
ncbi:hypothetical protein AG1IA_04506 [Rhizoctonia solani AG-1 IA]|uniref:Uncharacterized protein n=1 Tax=Thanatephorus cucumeris (strain AG1-IA) TaxID=983506 RepID=L8WTY3_THACA|nr:hypothetical protein AG1IA_04506 [Rhizoctonia solani AG-1 IA]